MDVDVLIIGAVPAGLATACRLKQLNPETHVMVLEKGSEVGAHILSGAIMQPTAMNELFPDWQAMGAPLNTPVIEDEVYYFTERMAIKFPKLLEPKLLKNHGNYIVSLGNVCRWLAEQAERLGVEIYPGFAASELLFGNNNQITGVITGDMGLDANSQAKDSYMPGMEIHASYTVFSEGCRGHLGKQLIKHYQLDDAKDPQHYGLGIKELWQIDPAVNDDYKAGLVLHTAGWPVSESLAKENSRGGGFLYQLENNQISLGFISELSYQHPFYDPYQEMQRWKTHPSIAKFLKGGKRISYGARAIAKGGLQSLPKMHFAGGLLIGCDAGTLNNAKIKGSHTAMKSGMLAAETIQSALDNGRKQADLVEYEQAFKDSWIYQELHQQKNWGPARHHFGEILGGIFSFIDINLFNGKLPIVLNDTQADYAASTSKQALANYKNATPIDYPKADGILTFNKLDSVFLSNTNHSEDQPCHLVLQEADIPLKHLTEYIDGRTEPSLFFCPAGVYEKLENKNGEEKNTLKFQINSQNCLHCKTCDIKDPAQNINWAIPEGGDGPNYPNM
ncbi:MAG: electron transfer flavoprotein-ubiquinone oxidoreductase [Oleispira sp.]|nr:electron transfer flavoprotein-ubiquinone oxidoreductase [Oleispira sp.]